MLNTAVASEVIVGDSGATSTVLTPGTIVGDYRIEGKLAEGGMGTVYAAVHRMIGKRAAIKVVRGELWTTAQGRERFVQEARVVNQINHPNIVDIFSLGTLEDGRIYLVMELLRGQTLAERMAVQRLSPIEVTDVLLQVCSALAAAHANGIIHRDLKPENLFLAEVDGAVAIKLLDWGIAKTMDALPKGPTMTTTGMMLGTPQYVSPEQARGKQIDHRTDVYSLGAIAYELFLEGPPFVGESVADVIAMHLHMEPPPPSDVWPDIPRELERLMLAMLAKDAGARPPLADVAATLVRVRHELMGRASGRRMAAGTSPPPVVTPLSASEVLRMQDRPTLPALPPRILTPWPGSTPQARARRATMKHRTGGVTIKTRPRWWSYAAATLSFAGLGAVAILILRDPTARRSEASADAMPAPTTVIGELDGTGATAPVVPDVEPMPVAAPEPTPPPMGALELRLKPADAALTIDGKPVVIDGGRGTLPVPQGLHELEISAPGYQHHRRTVDVAGEPLPIQVELDRAPTPRPTPDRADRGGSRREQDKTFNPDGTIDPFR